MRFTFSKNGFKKSALVLWQTNKASNSLIMIKSSTPQTATSLSLLCINEFLTSSATILPIVTVLLTELLL